MEGDKLHSFGGGLGLGVGWGGLQPHQATTHAAAACGCGTRPSAVQKRGLNPGRLCRAARGATGGLRRERGHSGELRQATRPSGVMDASVPPASKMSDSPYWMYLSASPMA